MFPPFNAKFVSIKLIQECDILISSLSLMSSLIRFPSPSELFVSESSVAVDDFGGLIFVHKKMLRYVDLVKQREIIFHIG